MSSIRVYTNIWVLTSNYQFEWLPNFVLFIDDFLLLMKERSQIPWVLSIFYSELFGLMLSNMNVPKPFLRCSAAVCHSWPLYQLDIKNAFLPADHQVEIYMDQQPGYVVDGIEHIVCQLWKALYGLKQSSPV